MEELWVFESKNVTFEFKYLRVSFLMDDAELWGLKWNGQKAHFEGHGVHYGKPFVKKLDKDAVRIFSLPCRMSFLSHEPPYAKFSSKFFFLCCVVSF